MLNRVQPDSIRHLGGWTVIEYDRGKCACGIREVNVLGTYFTVEEAQEAARNGAPCQMFYWK